MFLYRLCNVCGYHIIHLWLQYHITSCSVNICWVSTMKPEFQSQWQLKFSILINPIFLVNSRLNCHYTLTLISPPWCQMSLHITFTIFQYTITYIMTTWWIPITTLETQMFSFSKSGCLSPKIHNCLNIMFLDLIRANNKLWSRNHLATIQLVNHIELCLFLPPHTNP